MEQPKGSISLLGGDWVSGFVFRSLHQREIVSGNASGDLILLSESTDHDPTSILGQTVTVSLSLGERGIRYFGGVVSHYKHAGREGEHHLYEFEVRPWLWLLSLSTNSRIFQNQTAVDAIKAVFRLHGLTDFVEWLRDEYQTREYIVQYGETDEHFVRRLLEEEGIHFFFLHERERQVLVLCDDPAAHQASPFYATLPFLPPDEQRRADLDHVRSCHVTESLHTGSSALSDFNFEAPRLELLVSRRASGSHPRKDFESFEYPGGYGSTQIGERVARKRVEELEVRSRTTDAAGNAAGLALGDRLVLENFPAPSETQQYWVQSLDLTLTAPALESSGSHDDVEEQVSCKWRWVPVGAAFRPRRRLRKPHVYGLQTATVVGKAGEEIWTDRFGRVKVKFPWDRYVPDDEEQSSCWMRVAQVSAGTGFGGVHIPRVGEEVLVQFIDGDPDRPLVMGRVYNAANLPPYELPQNKTRTVLRSRSTPKGAPDNFNEISFEDAKGAEDLFIQAERSQTTKVKGSQSISVAGSRSLSVGGSQSITVAKAETETYQAERTVSVKAADSEAYEGGRTVSVTGADDVLEVGINRRVTVGTGYTIAAGTLYQVANGANVLHLEGAMGSFTNGQCTVKLEGANAVVEATGSIELRCGQSTITLSPAGITLSSLKVNVAGGSGKLDLEPSGATMTGPQVKLDGAGLTEVRGALVRIN